MNNRWRQIFKDFKKWNAEIQKEHGNKHKCLSKTERKVLKKRKEISLEEFIFEEVE